MSRVTLRNGWMWSALAIAMLGIPATADAGWRHGGWHGWSSPPVLGWTGYNYGYFATGWSGIGCCDHGVLRPAYVPVASVCCDPCWGTTRVRPVGLLGRIGYRRHAHHWNYYWGWRAPRWGLATWGVGACCAGCGCTMVDCCCDGAEGDVFYGEPSIIHEGESASPTPATPPAGDAQGLPSPEQQTSYDAGNALLTVHVPAEARVVVNGVPTRSTGDVRRYVSRNLTAGYHYTYEVTAEVQRDGRPVTQTKTVQLRAGEEVALAFDLQAAKAVETALTLHVPSDAKVYLAGTETRGNGSVRTFRTTKLAGSSEWSQYSVRVTVTRGGEELTKEERITLRGGEQTELTFDFDVDKVAAVR